MGEPGRTIAVVIVEEVLLGPAPAFNAVGRVGVMEDKGGMDMFNTVFVGAVVKVGRPSAEMRGGGGIRPSLAVYWAEKQRRRGGHLYLVVG